MDAAELSNLLSDEPIAIAIREMASSIASIKEFNFTHYNKVAGICVDDCRIKLREISSGNVAVPARTAQAYGMLGIQQAQTDVKAIHMIEAKYWMSDFGRKSFELNKLALKRGVHITRIFALNSEEIKDSAEILKEQAKAGIDVVVVERNYVKREFAIYDNRIVIDFDVFSKENPSVELEQIILDPTQVKTRINEFHNLIARYGKTLKEVISAT